jgi:hypothetical protein
VSTKGPGEQLSSLPCLKMVENLKPARVPGAKIAPDTLLAGRSLCSASIQINANRVFLGRGLSGRRLGQAPTAALHPLGSHISEGWDQTSERKVSESLVPWI